MGYRSKQYSLKKIILLTIAGLSTASTLLTALLLHYNYDGKLLQEFQSKISTESHNVSLGLSNKLNQVTHQLKEISLDNSIRVTLMLEVDTQLEERLARIRAILKIRTSFCGATNQGTLPPPLIRH